MNAAVQIVEANQPDGQMSATSIEVLRWCAALIRSMFELDGIRALVDEQQLIPTHLEQASSWALSILRLNFNQICQ